MDQTEHLGEEMQVASEINKFKAVKSDNITQRSHQD